MAEFPRRLPDLTVAGRGRPAAIALLCCLLTNWTILVAIERLSLVSSFDHLAFEPVTWWTGLGVLAAATVYEIVDKWGANTDRRFLHVAIVALVVSFLPTIWLLEADPTATRGAILSLMAMHVTVAVICVFAMTAYRPSEVGRFLRT